MKKTSKETKVINNAFYDDLGEDWYEGDKHPIALLRAENRARNPWILSRIQKEMGSPCRILDIGCGAGFLTNALALAGHKVTGIDLSEKSLTIARMHDTTKGVTYLNQDAFSLNFPGKSFDVICAMDFLEHIKHPEQIIRQVACLLQPGGLFFFHTFNRNFWSWLTVIKGVDWLVPNAPKDMHIYSLFITPSELKQWCQKVNLQLVEIHGLMPQVASLAFWKSLLRRRVASTLQFQLTSSLTNGYLGIFRS